MYNHTDSIFHVKPTPPTPPPKTIKGGVEGVSNQSNHNTPMHIGCRVFIRKEARTCLNPRVPHVPLFFASMSTPTPKSNHKSTTDTGEEAPHGGSTSGQGRAQPREEEAR
jgi:hypothetical protein